MSNGGGAGAAGAVPRRRAAILVICAAALALMAPELVSGLSFSDSLRYNIVWTEQFAEQFRGGDLYPRWLGRSWDGLGSPTFYFYPPLFFWVAALVNLATVGALGTEALVSAASLIFLVASGLAMRAWLSEFSPGRASLFGALAYMAAPYHLYDIYGRGALAEASAYALLPLLMLALRRVGEGRRGFVLLVALSYAGLVMAHLPVALLVSVFVLPPYVVFEARRSGLAFLAQAFAGGVLGLALAAVYLVPALSLTGHISSAALFGGFYEPSAWFFWRPDAWPRKGPVLLTMAVSAAALLLALGAARVAKGEGRRDAFFWVGIAAVAFVMASGALPFLWELPFLAQVQFPSRILPIAEFAAVTALAIGRPRIREPLVFLGALPAIGALATAAGAVSHAAEKRRTIGGEEIARIRADLRDAPEYLPVGFPIAVSAEGVPESALIRLPAPHDAAGVHVEPRRDGGARVTVESVAPTTVVIRRFHFPHWRVTDEAGRRVPSGPSPERLLSWRAGAGRSVFLVERGAVPGERLGLGLSAAALLALAIAALRLSRRAPRRR